MPLFFLIAIAAGAITVGSTANDVSKRKQLNRAEAPATVSIAAAGTSYRDCLADAARRAIDLNSCQK